MKRVDTQEGRRFPPLHTSALRHGTKAPYCSLTKTYPSANAGNSSNALKRLSQKGWVAYRMCRHVEACGHCATVVHQRAKHAYLGAKVRLILKSLPPFARGLR